MFTLAGKSVVVTGGSKGIGRGIASVFATADANVAIGARSQADIDSAVAALDGLGAGKVMGVAVDVSDRDSCTAMAEAVVGAFGGLDVLCANAGIFPDAPLQTMTPDQLTDVLDVNVKGTVLQRAGLSRCADRVGAGVTIVLTSSITGPHHRVSRLVGTTVHPKAAQLGFMRTRRDRTPPRTGSPSTRCCLATSTHRRACRSRRRLPGRDGAGVIPAGRARHAGRHRLRARGLFLASDEAGYITGQAIAVDGGARYWPESPGRRDALTRGKYLCNRGNIGLWTPAPI